MRQSSTCGPLRRVLAYVFLFGSFQRCCALRSAEQEDEGSLSSVNVSSSALEVEKLLRQECGRFSTDNWRAPTEDSCFVLMFRCTNDKHEKDAANHNVGDLAWGLSKECRAYGRYLKMYYIEFARVWLSHSGPYDGGVIYGKGGYEQCNYGPHGFVCGCGMQGTSCGDAPGTSGKDANNFGWRVVPDILHWSYFHDYDTCPCVQYALPKRAQGQVDAVKSKEFIEGSGWKNRSNSAYFQWKQVGKPKTIDFVECIDTHVKTAGTTDIEEIIANFQRAVIDGQEKACKKK